MRHIGTIVATLAATLLVANPALADDPTADETPTEETAAVPAVADASPAEEAPADETAEPVRSAEVDPTIEEGATPTPTPPADAAPVDGEEEEEGGTSGWFRIDTDGLQTQFWVGATHSVGSFDIASDIYVVGSFAEFDIGPSFSIGNLALRSELRRVIAEGRFDPLAPANDPAVVEGLRYNQRQRASTRLAGRSPASRRPAR